jgi:hypothetical protein
MKTKISVKKYLQEIQMMADQMCIYLKIPSIKIEYQNNILTKDVLAYYEPNMFKIFVSDKVNSAIISHELNHYVLDLISKSNDLEESLIESATTGFLIDVMDNIHFKKDLLRFDKFAMAFTK